MSISTRAQGGWTYADALAVIDELRSIGVEAGVTVGGVWLSFDLELQGVAVVEIVKRHHGQFCRETMMQALTEEYADRVIRRRQIEMLERMLGES